MGEEYSPRCGNGGDQQPAGSRGEALCPARDSPVTHTASLRREANLQDLELVLLTPGQS